MFCYKSTSGGSAQLQGRRIPVEGLTLAEQDDQLDGFVEHGLLTCEEVAAEGYEMTYLEDMSVKELKAYAAENDISLTGAKKKLDILHVIESALDD